MNEINDFRNDLLTLSGILEKLLKVIRHSDPTAKSKQHLLYKKYQQKLQVITRRLKVSVSWETLQQTIKTLPTNSEFTVEKESTEVVLRKLLNDFEKEYVSKPVFQEFTASKGNGKPGKRKPTRPKQMKPSPPPAPKEVYTEESLGEMVRLTRKQLHARGELRKLVDAINRIGPENIEEKIKKLTSIK